jgi:hypothetical protein
VGIRLRPTLIGGKIETLYLVVREKDLGVGIAVGLGADGFYRRRHRVVCDAGGCFRREYGGVVVDVPLIVSRHLWRRGSLFLAARFNYLYLSGEESYKSRTGAFTRLSVDKSVSQPLGGWLLGLEIDGHFFRLVPQMAGALVKLPSGSLTHVIYPMVELSLVL